ncbi:oxidoreductase alpha (molybdopterin) subunit [Rubritalea squalenifaciens DSM 18772]|uniref:Oxidoreductase alpha (Molybdopterin) subunit n=2 Tax=Rubritalea squalenifaciens TaxID=407226 RepID=A0A1M6R751_9BACT|nr:oxidoreductase alpha (molybdopterin) subunit [Rubritalea squalenifaciens DSM 18772]
MQSEDAPMKRKAPKTWAAGRPAVISSMKHVMSTAGPVRGTKALLELNQMDGFDCPSCAWPDPDDHRAITEFCENGAKAIASEATSKIIDERFFREHSIEQLLGHSDYWHDQQGRLTHPMILEEGATHYKAISWEDAFQLIAKELKALPDPNQAVFYTSGRTSNEAAFLYQLFVRHYGTNNLPDCSNMCHESSGSALGAAIGIGKGTVSLHDLEQADVIICVGQNPGTNHPRMLSTLEACVKNGGEVVAINPLREAGLMGFAHPQKVSGMFNHATKLATQYLQVKINGDMAIFRGLAKIFFEREEKNPGHILDHTFIEQHTAGFFEYKESCDATSWEQIEDYSGISRAEMETLADSILHRDKKLVTCWAMGLTQHENAVDTIREVTNLHLLIGAIGREGAGLCPVRGHSNVQGDRTMGIFEKLPEWFHQSLEKVFKFESPRPHGFDVVEAIHAMHEEKAHVFFAMGGNFLQAAPDTNYTAEALRKCRLTCHVATKLNRSHLVTGKTGLILPCLGRTDLDMQSSGPQFVTCENSMGVVHMSTGRLTPPSTDLLSEPAIIAGIAEATVGDTSIINWSALASNYNLIRDFIEEVIPGFDNFNERVREPGGFYLHNSAKERTWNTETQKANFNSAALSIFQVKDSKRLILQTLRSHDQYNTTIYGLDDRYRGIGNERMILFLNPEDMQELGIKPAQKVRITSHWKDGERHAEGFYAIPYEMPRGAAAAYFPEANVLVPASSTAKISNTPTSKAIEITLEVML